MKIQVDPEKTYADARALEYPDIRDQADAMMKGFAALQGMGLSLPKETRDWIETCQAVKQRFPKP